ncbi:Hpt domain-containing protein [Vannielia sp.]|uniref:Hpt domain-containing protein n=1 Tax=Vannielia sp. TaxID=2813045 RepID=UPI0026241635|nr:Hpt domain-containing protein [Vannielia sp.]MDF1873620.1 Hpt domain-containing protein [Vannielia sp.]
MIDWDRVAELIRIVGEDDFAEIADMFLEEVDEVLERMEIGESSDWEADFHFLKSSSLNLGFTDLARLCQTAENWAHEQNGEADYVAEIAASYRASCRAFESKRAA